MNINGVYVKSTKNDIENIENVMIIKSNDLIIVMEKFEIELFNMFDGNLTIRDISILLFGKYKNAYKEQDFYDFVEKLINTGIIEEKNYD